MSSPLIVDKITLFSVVDFGALQSHLKSNLIAYPTNQNELRNLWEKTNNAYQHIGSASRSFLTSEDIKPVDKNSKEKYDKLLSRIKQYSTYSAYPTNIYNVRISKLVTPQLVINLSRANRWTNVRKNMKPDELCDLLFQPPNYLEKITCQTLGEGNSSGSLLFTSYNEDTRLYHPPQFRTIPVNENDPQSPNFQSVCILIGGGLPFASAYRVQIGDGITRLILNNGIHRIYKLAERGVEWCPIVISDVTYHEIPETFVGTPRSILLNPKLNPALILDFLNKDVVIPLKYYRILKTIRLNWNYEQYETVLR
jgi:hypothetical protein